MKLPDVMYVGSVEVRKDDELTVLEGRVLRIERRGSRIFVPLRQGGELISIRFTTAPPS